MSSALIAAQCVADILEIDLCSCDDRVARRIKAIIEGVSAEVRKMTRRTLCAGAGIVECVAPQMGPRIFLSRTPLRRIHSVECLKCGQVFAGVCVDNVKAGILMRCCGWCTCSCRPGHFITGDYAPGDEQKTIKVTYDGGYVTTAQAREVDGPFLKQEVTFPADLREALCQLAASRYALECRPVGVKAQSNLGASITYADNADMPESTRERILCHRAVRI